MSSACPESFDEFYNQRRRWMPSTLLNIADLIGDYKQVSQHSFPKHFYPRLIKVVEKNDDISLMYILYQAMMMVGTLIGKYLILMQCDHLEKQVLAA